MSNACIFCEVVADRRDDEIVYSDDRVLAFLDNLRQPSPGHVLVIPKDHTENIWTIDTSLGNNILRTAKLVSQAIKDTLSCDGIILWVSNGPGAGQEVMHFHLHVFPRHSGDRFFQILKEGAAKVTRSGEDGREVILAFVRRDDLFGGCRYWTALSAPRMS